MTPIVGTPVTGPDLDDDSLITKPRNAPFTATQTFTTGQTVGVQIVNYPNVAVARTTDVDEIAPGIYEASLTAPSVAGDYSILWDCNGVWQWSQLRVTSSLYTAATEDVTPDYMTEAEAAARLERMCLAGEDPSLTADDIADLLGVSARPDEDGYTRLDDEWTPTWDLNAGAAEGWLRKAGIASARFNFAEDGQRFDRAQIFQHCEAQRRIYADRAMGSIPISNS
jgi:hypothetical protein